jgi:hypothetical protein
MKKFLSLTLSIICATLIHSQTTAKDLTAAQKAAMALAKTYDFTTEQTKSALKIQEDKFIALGKIEKFKSTDLKKYNAKKLSIAQTVDNELAVLLDERQLVIFKQHQAQKSKKYADTVLEMKKRGAVDAEIQKKIAETEF